MYDKCLIKMVTSVNLNVLAQNRLATKQKGQTAKAPEDLATDPMGRLDADGLRTRFQPLDLCGFHPSPVPWRRSARRSA